MPDPAHTFLTDLLATQDGAAGYGCGLEPRLLELLLDRHITRNGVVPLGRALRVDGPPQPVPPGLSRVGRSADISAGSVHVRR